MSAASELRKALKDFKYPLSQGGVIVRQWQSDEVVDAILDAVIAALPERRMELTKKGSGYVPDYYAMGGNQTLDAMIDLLQSAKTQKGEE